MKGKANDMTTTVIVKEKYAETLTMFGSLQDVVGSALQRYAIELLTAKINDLQRREAAYQQRYGLDYPTFGMVHFREESTFTN